jgi:hypothetical protein
LNSFASKGLPSFREAAIEISGPSAPPARRGGPVGVSTREGKMMKCRHQTNQSLITIHALLDLELSKKASKLTQDSAHRNRN